MTEEVLEIDQTDVSELPDGNTFTADEGGAPEYGETDEVTTDDKKEDKEEPDKLTSDLESRFTELEKNYQRASSHIEDLNKALSQVRRENRELKKTKTDDDGEPVFTDAQLLAIMDENKDDSGVLLQAVKQLIKQNSVDIQKLTDKKVELVGKRSEVDGVMKGWMPWVEKNQETIDKIVDYHGLQDLPDWQKIHLALGAILVKRWPQEIEAVKEQTRKELLGDKYEDSRKTTIKNNKPETSKEDAKVGAGDIKASWIESGQRLGLKGKKLDAYFELMKKSSQKRSD